MGALVRTRRQATQSAPQTVVARQYLTFALGEEMFGLWTLMVKEIIEYGQITTVPMMPESIRGVINLRGAVVPIIDLAVRFQHRHSAPTRRTCIVILEVAHGSGRQEIGIVVDAVSEVLEIKAADIEPPPTFGAHIRTDFIEGMARIENRFVILLKVSEILSGDELAALAGVPSGAAAGSAA